MRRHLGVTGGFIMEEAKRQWLEAAGFRVGSASEFLGLSDAENALVEMKLASSSELKQRQTRMNQTIVVADHDGEFREELVAALRGAGYEVDGAASGEELIQRLAVGIPDLLIWSMRIEFDTFKALDPWRPGSVVSKLARISISGPSSSTEDRGCFSRAPDTVRPLLIGHRPMPIPVVLDAVRRVLLPD